ncbi:uncharacterized protein LOC132558208 [Ylistrum balloti]|uniref:uncharacterized protein LOC132558208 n=1 Tax=Ylistrum balloti TaxID=509963 RepID=UPI002905A713|nr:uncharacterized protein LOC132558208 [Ylistrum balloti]
MSNFSNDRRQEIDITDARDDLLACVKPGKYLCAGVFITTLGAAYASQEIYMYRTKNFVKSRNRWLLPFGAAFIASYGFFINIYLKCRKEVLKDYPQLNKTRQPSSSSSPKSTEFDDDETSST